MSAVQLIVAVMFMFGFVASFISTVKDDSLSSAGATLAIFIEIAIKAAYVALLHAGGFW